MSVPLRNERRWGVAGMQRDKAPVEWSRSEGGDPTEGSVLGRLLRKPTPWRGLLQSHTGQSQWSREKGKTGRRRTREMKGRVGAANKQLCTEQTAKGTRQHDNGGRRQIPVCEQGCARPRLWAALP